MNVLGSYLIGTHEQRSLADGQQHMLPRIRIMANILERARVGDLLWVKEPWMLVTSRQFGKQNIHECVVGPVGTRMPDHIKAHMADLRVQIRSALQLDRQSSRMTFQIESLDLNYIAVRVLFRQVDAVVKAWRNT